MEDSLQANILLTGKALEVFREVQQKYYINKKSGVLFHIIMRYNELVKENEELKRQLRKEKGIDFRTE